MRTRPKEKAVVVNMLPQIDI